MQWTKLYVASALTQVQVLLMLLAPESVVKYLELPIFSCHFLATAFYQHTFSSFQFIVSLIN